MEVYEVKLPWDEKDVAEYLKSRRNFSNVKILAINKSVVEFLKLHNVKSLILSGNYLGSSYSISQITQVLKENKSLTSLTLSYGKLIESSEVVEVVELNKLEHLSIIGAFDNLVLANIIFNSLKTVVIRNCSSLNYSLVFDLLYRQTSLDKLVIYYGEHFFGHVVVVNLPFKLKHLVVTFADSERISRQIFDFLTPHIDSLLKLSLNSVLGEDILGLVLRKMKKVKILELCVHKLPTDEASWFWDELEPLTNVQELKIYKIFPNTKVARNFFKLFPSLKNLDAFHLNSYWFTELPTMIPHLEQLIFRYRDWYMKQLDVENKSSAHESRLIFPKLRKICVHEADLNDFYSNSYSSYQALRMIPIFHTKAEGINPELYDVCDECSNPKCVSFRKLR